MAAETQPQRSAKITRSPCRPRERARRARERERRLDVMIRPCRERGRLLRRRDGDSAAAREATRSPTCSALEARSARPACDLPAERRRVDSLNVAARQPRRGQPKGVVGVIAPWNYPIMLLLTPVASAFAAGDAVLLKPSELAPRTALLIARLVNGAYDESIARVVLGGPQTSAALAALPLDHLVFTGSTRVGKLVAAACAQNLTPTTLELGGKCPVIVGRRADVVACAKRVVHGKILNSGQTCLAPDYVFVEESVRDAFVKAFERTMRMFPGGAWERRLRLDYK